MISMAIGLLGGVETSAISVGKKDADGSAFADTFEQVAASGRTKVAVGGTQGAVKIDQGTGQARKVGGSGQNDGEVKQANGGLAAAKDGIGVQGGKGATAGKKIVDVAEVVEEQVAGGAGDAGQDLVVRVGVPGASGQGGQGRGVVAAKAGVGSAQDAGGAEIEVAGLSNPVTVASGDGAEVFESEVQRTIGASRDGAGRTFGSSAVAQEQVSVASEDIGEKAVGASIRPDLKGSGDVADVGLPVASGQGSALATAAAPVLLGKNGSAPVVKGLTKAVDENALPESGVETASVESDVPAFVPAENSKGFAASSLQADGTFVPKTNLQTRQIVAGDAAESSLSEIAQSADSAKRLADGVAVPARRVAVATSGLEQWASESAIGKTTSVDASATASALLPRFGSTKGNAAIPVAGARGSAVVGASTGAKAGVSSLVASAVPTSVNSGTEGIAVKGDGGPGAEAVITHALPVASTQKDVPASAAQPGTVADVQTQGIQNGLPRVAAAAESGAEAFQGAVATVVAQPVAGHAARSGQDGSKTTAKSAGRYDETKSAKKTSAPAIGDGKIVAEASAAGVAAPTVVAANVAAAAPVAAVSQTVASDVTSGEAGRGVVALAGTGAGTTPRLQSSDAGAGVHAAQGVTLPGSVTETVASQAVGPKVAKDSTGQASGIPSDAALTNAPLTDAGQGIEAQSQGSLAVGANGAVAPVAAEAGEVAAGTIAPVKAGQERKTVGGTASVGGRERKGAAAESKTGDVAASAGAVDAGRTVAVASSVDTGLASAKPVGTEHRGQGSEGGQVLAAAVASVDGAAVQAHVASGIAANVAAAPAASVSGSAETSVTAAGGAHTGSAGDSLISPMAHTTLEATPTVLEVGVPGGTHGWLKIRAEIGEGGAVQASMSAASHAGQDALRRDLPAMNAFLESEHVPVSLQVTHGAGSSLADGGGAMKDGGFSLGSGLGSGLGQSAGQDAQGRSEARAGMLADAGSDGARQQGTGPNSQDVVSGAGSRGGVAAQSVIEGEAAWSAAPGYGSGLRANGGSWLNVMA